MKIINNKVDDLNTFGNLANGDVFIYNDDIMMKVAPHSDDVADWNAVDLDFGELHWLPEDKRVILVSAELIIS